MRRVFLSYAEEDGSAAEQLAAWLQDNGVEVFWWEDPRQRGQRIRGKLEKELKAADHFFALMSQHYLASGWCQRECDVAIGREDMVIKVVRVGAAEPKDAGFLGIYDWLDLDLAALSEALEFTVENGAGEPPPFRNREDELGQVQKALSTSGGHDLWVVVAPPRMGKSWFLERLRSEVEGRWRQVRVLDLRHEPADLRIDPAKLLNALLGVEVTATGRALTQDVRLDVARQVRRRRSSQLYVLDSADLLDRSCAAELRSALAQVRASMGSGTNGERFGVVIGTRRRSDWMGMINGRFEHVLLSAFAVETVAKTIEAYGRTSRDETMDCAALLHAMSEGLPALLAGWLIWAKDKDFFGLTEAECERQFCTVVEPYVRDDLLTVASLVPEGGKDLARTLDLIQLALRRLVVYRFFTKSHLSFQLETDDQFREAAERAGWTVKTLWEAVSGTSLIETKELELWQYINPPVRRLLYRYFHHHQSDEDRAKVHADAQRFYRGWIEKAAGLEQPRVMLECLWHETSRLLAEQPQTLPDTLPGLASQLAREFITSEMYDKAEVVKFVEGALRRDSELESALKGYDGLFDRVLESITASFSEDRS